MADDKTQTLFISFAQQLACAIIHDAFIRMISLDLTSSPATFCQSQDWARMAPAAHAPAALPAFGPVIPQVAVIRRARVPARESPAADCPADFLAAAQSDGQASRAEFRMR